MVYCKHCDKFCFLCGQFTSQKSKRNKSEKFQLLFRSYYDMEWIDEEYVPQIGCSACYKSLSEWFEKRKDKPKYKVSMLWLNPGEHNAQNCYFCLNFLPGTNTTKKGAVKYIATEHAILPIDHSDSSPPLNVSAEPIPEFDQDDAIDIVKYILQQI